VPALSITPQGAKRKAPAAGTRGDLGRSGEGVSRWLARASYTSRGRRGDVVLSAALLVHWWRLVRRLASFLDEPPTLGAREGKREQRSLSSPMGGGQATR